MFTPSYIALHQTGELAERAEALAGLSRPCRLCPHGCAVERTPEKLGVCGSGHQVRVSGAFAHFGEEPPLVGRLGSGTIFFCGCNLRCCFCQNWDISHGTDRGHALSDEQLARLMLELQLAGCHNINLVTPTHYVHGIVAALELAAGQGLSLPLVYNCGGYESPEVLGLLEGVVDIYMPDAKFFDDGAAAGFVSAADYGTRAREAIAEMHRQVGVLQCTPDGIAHRGLLIRHLVMPGSLAGTRAWAHWIAASLSPDSYVNIMDQYRPCHRASDHPEINRRPAPEEYRQAVEEARAAGLSGRGFLNER
ncbi:MAG: radical SAM protein [Candidatus Glassbacteria bacterium]|nr:radical SAM protein [Candidatus Glassbacteria bacterium]